MTTRRYTTSGSIVEQGSTEVSEKNQAVTLTAKDGISLDQLDPTEKRAKHGLNVGLTSFFMVAQMAGAGFLALPRAFADAGWLGLVMMLLFCVSVAFSATKLGDCWMMMEERYPEYRNPARQPYMEIAYRALGDTGRKISFALLLITNIGSTTVFIILMSELIESVIPKLSLCEWALVVTAIVIPLTWLGTPKDFWQASVFAVISTALAVIIIIVKIFLDHNNHPIYPPPSYPHPTLSSFSLGFGAILFAYGGSSVFPTIQNDMKDRSVFWKSVIISFAVILCMYLPVALFGYLYFGDSVNSNIILTLTSGPAITVAIIFEIFNLLGTFIITMSPVFQSLEDVFSVPHDFGIKRMCLRSGIVLLQLVVALGFPDFGLVLNLIGGSTMSCLSFVLPPLMYIRLVDDKSHKDCPQREIPLWMRIFLYEIMFVGIAGGLSSTISALFALLSPENLKGSCFVQFGVQDT